MSEVSGLRLDALRCTRGGLERALQRYGMEATPGEKEDIEGLVASLEALSSVDLSGPDGLLIEGEWQLLYTSGQEFRSSPFFW